MKDKSAIKYKFNYNIIVLKQFITHYYINFELLIIIDTMGQFHQFIKFKWLYANYNSIFLTSVAKRGVL